MNISIGNYDEALVYYKEALDVSRSILGNTHPDTLVSISCMGNVLRDQGKIDNANMIWPQLMIPFNVYCYVYK